VVDGVVFSTDQFEPELRDEAWREVTRPFFATSLLADDRSAGFQGSIATRMIGELMVSATTFNGQRYHRDRRLVVQSGLDQYLLQLFTAGSLRGHGDGHDMDVVAGDICIFDLARPATTEIMPGATFSLVLPRERMDRALQGHGLHGKVLKANMPLTRVLSDLIVSLYRLDMDVAPDEALAIQEAMIHLLATAATRNVTGFASDASALAQLLRERILEFIDAHLHEGDLGTVLLMRRFQISRAHLYRVFADDGGVAGLIRDRRLDAAFREITRGWESSGSITEIAFRFGFSNSSQFARAFRERFALTPSEARHERGLNGRTERSTAELRAHFERLAAPIPRDHTPGLGIPETR
jgi:AraC-like DNA-binding protein